MKINIIKEQKGIIKELKNENQNLKEALEFEKERSGTYRIEKNMLENTIKELEMKLFNKENVIIALKNMKIEANDGKSN